MQKASTSKPIIGLVGGIGAGKSTAAAAFASRGGVVINADAIGHEALEDPAVRERVLSRWNNHGPLVRPDGRIDRRAIGSIVFADDAERRALEAMVFPIITKRVREEIERAEHNFAIRFIVLDAAVMLEAGWNDVCDHLVYVDAPRDVRLARLASRSGWSAADVTARESAQMAADEKRKRSDVVLMNDGSQAMLQNHVDQLLREWNLMPGSVTEK